MKADVGDPRVSADILRRALADVEAKRKAVEDAEAKAWKRWSEYVEALVVAKADKYAARKVLDAGMWLKDAEHDGNDDIRELLAAVQAMNVGRKVK